MPDHTLQARTGQLASDRARVPAAAASTVTGMSPAARWALAITSIAVFMVTLDNLVVTTAIPVLRERLHAGLSGDGRVRRCRSARPAAAPLPRAQPTSARPELVAP